MRTSGRTLVILPLLLLVAACSASPQAPSPQVTPQTESAGSSPAAPVDVSGSALPAVPQGQQPEVVPLEARLSAPSLTMRTPEGEEVQVGSGASAPQVVVFLAHWCPACQQEVPSLVSTIAAGGLPTDVELVVVLTAFDSSRPNWPPLAWLDREGLVATDASTSSGRVVVVVDDENMTAMSSFGLSAFPGWAIVASDGTVMSRFSGLVQPESVPTIFQVPSGS